MGGFQSESDDRGGGHERKLGMRGDQCFAFARVEAAARICDAGERGEQSNEQPSLGQPSLGRPSLC